MRYSESQANREIDKISDQHAFNRYTINTAMEDDDIAYSSSASSSMRWIWKRVDR